MVSEGCTGTDWHYCGGGCRDLSSNRLAKLPESFGNLWVGGDLYVPPLYVLVCAWCSSDEGLQGCEGCNVTLIGGAGVVSVAGLCATTSLQQCQKVFSVCWLGVTCKCCPCVCLRMHDAVLLQVFKQGGNACTVTLISGVSVVAIAGTCPTIGSQFFRRPLATCRLWAACKCCPCLVLLYAWCSSDEWLCKYLSNVGRLCWDTDWWRRLQGPILQSACKNSRELCKAISWGNPVSADPPPCSCTCMVQ